MAVGGKNGYKGGSLGKRQALGAMAMTKSTRSGQAGRLQASYGRAVVPVALATVLFAGLIFGYLLPQQERLIIERKKEMLRELTASAVSMLAEHERDGRTGVVSPAEAKRLAITRLRDLRYGREGKDYFWIIDHQPRMVMHPYRPDLEGKQLSDYRDPDGKALFLDARAQVAAHGEGFVAYRWQWKDDAARVVPKLSYVRGFAPWGYIVGTGIYLDDVHDEMRGLRNRLLTATLLILASIVVLMVYGARQTIVSDAHARKALQELRDSEQKYRLLSEAVGEGSLLAVDGAILHPNRALLELLGCSAEALVGKPLAALFADANRARALAEELSGLADGKVWQGELEVRSPAGVALQAEVSVFPVEVLGRRGLSVVVRDVSAGKRLAGELARSRERARWLAMRFGLGVFRADTKESWPLIEVDDALGRMLGAGKPQELLGKPLLGLLPDAEEAARLRAELESESSLHARAFRVRGLDGRVRTLSISAVMTRSNEGGAAVVDGLVEDVTWRKEAEVRVETLKHPAQADVLADARPVGLVARPTIACGMQWSVAEAGGRLARAGEEAALVTAPDGAAIGMLSWKSLGAALLPGGAGPKAPCHQAMVAPIPAIATDTPLFAALEFARSHGLAQVPLRHADGGLHSMASVSELLSAQGRTLPFLLREIAEARTEEALIESHARVPGVVRTLLESGANPSSTSRTLTVLSDAFTRRAIELTVARLGPPPAEFAFLALGSEGRGEQTLVTDQDNALIWSDVDAAAHKDAAKYFIALGEAINAALDRAGYAYCGGKVMAGNPQWNMSLSSWKDVVERWIHAADPQSLLGVNIFFDYRPVTRQTELADSLRGHIQSLLRGNRAFFYNFAAAILEYRPPLGFFGKILTDAKGGHAPAFNVKAAMVPLVSFARLYALHHGAHASSTLERLGLLKERGLLTPMGHRELCDAFACLLGLRLRHQAARLAEGHAPDNLINPKSLSRLELAQLREALGQIQIVQERVKLEWARRE